MTPDPVAPNRFDTFPSVSIDVEPFFLGKMASWGKPFGYESSDIAEV